MGWAFSQRLVDSTSLYKPPLKKRNSEYGVKERFLVTNTLAKVKPCYFLWTTYLTKSPRVCVLAIAHG
jgi:hypothetical protein